MLKKGLFIVLQLCKDVNNFLYLFTFNYVIINITILTFGVTAISLKVEGFKVYLKPFFYVKKSLLLTYKP